MQGPPQPSAGTAAARKARPWRSSASLRSCNRREPCPRKRGQRCCGRGRHGRRRPQWGGPCRWVCLGTRIRVCFVSQPLDVSARQNETSPRLQGFHEAVRFCDNLIFLICVPLNTSTGTQISLQAIWSLLEESWQNTYNLSSLQAHFASSLAVLFCIGKVTHGNQSIP